MEVSRQGCLVLWFLAFSVEAARSAHDHEEHATITHDHEEHARITPDEWSRSFKLPPWECSITEGSKQGMAIVLGQSMKPDGTAPEVMVRRAIKAKELLDKKKVEKVMVSGSDPAGVGETEASVMKKVLVANGIKPEDILMEPQAMTTAENAWFMLRFLPKGTGRIYIVTSDFHMPRATYIFKEVLNHFYRTMEATYKDDSRWTGSKKYPRLEIIQSVAPSFCGDDASLNRDGIEGADINTQSLAQRAANELKFLTKEDHGWREVDGALYGHPRSNMQYIWAVQVNVTKDPAWSTNLEVALGQAVNVYQKLCVCRSPPEKRGVKLVYPLGPEPILIPRWLPETMSKVPDDKTVGDVLATCSAIKEVDDSDACSWRPSFLGICVLAAMATLGV